MAALKSLSPPPILGVIVCHPKDFETLGPCLLSLRHHARQARLAARPTLAEFPVRLE